ncbi:TetR/AcrR family transcriptional regulator [Microbaculum marinum]|uniref:TetR/AcrR family transcriptional regulator n=1 Tax=Microbaculum marinum TaxID=1764581 RepID=A0AAW9RQZ7_9HYPH
MTGTADPRPGSPRGEETRTLILDTAERMFVERGYSGVTMRALTAEAGVNLAAVNYHFGTKDALLLEVFRRGSLAINRERARLLREAEALAAPGTAPVRDILRALFEPPLRATLAGGEASGGRSIYMQFVARAALDGPAEMRTMLERDVRHLERFVAALANALPALSRPELLWRFHFAMGVLHSIYHDLKRLDALADGVCDMSDADAIIGRVVDFAVAGLEQPLPLG